MKKLESTFWLFQAVLCLVLFSLQSCQYNSELSSDTSKYSEYKLESQLKSIHFADRDTTMLSYIISEINSAKDSLNIMVFKIDNKEISDAIIQASLRGVEIKMPIDVRDVNTKVQMTNTKNLSDSISAIDYLICNGIDLKYLDINGKNDQLYIYQKVLLIDNNRFAFGSTNFLTSAITDNFEFFMELSDTLHYSKFKDLFYEYWFEYGKQLTPTDCIKETSIFSQTTPQEYAEYEITKTIENPIEINDFLTPQEIDVRQFLIDNIRSAKDSILVAHSIFTDKEIFNELIKSLENGIQVKVVAGNGISKDFIKEFHKLGIPIKSFNKEAYQGNMHSKYILIDDSIILCGSLNLFKRSLEEDLENLIKITSKSFYNLFHKNFVDMFNNDCFI